MLFEIALGRLVLGLPWERLTEDYGLSRGGFIGLGLLFMALSPLLVAKLRSRPQATAARPADSRVPER